jgi:hypothetical protein
VTFGPRAPHAIATWAAGALATHSVNRNGEAASGPSPPMVLASFSVKSVGPKAVESTTAAVGSGASSDASARAIRAADTA